MNKTVDAGIIDPTSKGFEEIQSYLADIVEGLTTDE
jgi:hypothetical protein